MKHEDVTNQIKEERIKKERRKLGPSDSLNLGVMCAHVAQPITTSLSERL